MRRIAPSSARALLLLAILAGTAAPLLSQPPAAEAEAWETLEILRRALERGPLVADFEQLFLPAGFSEGESERGRMALALPECLRWDYAEPFPKSYLLCGEIAYTWNAGEPAGRRFLVAAEEEPGLDLLRLRVAALRSHYRASREIGEDGAILVRLEPAEPAAIRDAELLVEVGGERLRELAYRDAEGNRTRFRFGDYREEPAPGLFDPPPGLEWLEE